ncbi:MAG TPA: rRNA maturation RNase YbeY [Chitinophagaceae bacterium]|nr:rRNA maturation RNase YbeY [Chitinophagaceae bacterium]
MAARFHQHDRDPELKQKRKLSQYLDALVHRHLEGIKKISLDYIFCSDEHLLGINRQFLDHDTFTDIITFDLSEKENEMIGEIYISVDRIRDNAAKFKTSYEHELHRVIFHGALHLCGFTDKKPADKKEMTAQEDAGLQGYFA